MKILVFTINPIFPDKVTGGASKHLYYIINYLGNQGHQVEVLCPKTEDLSSPFSFGENIWVYPELGFSMPFPQPYAVSGPELSLITQRIIQRLESADRFYIHDGEWLIPDIYEHVPTVVSFRDNIYPESVLGTFIGKPDEVISVSDYSGDVIKNTAGLYFPGLQNRLHTVTNGIDFDFFRSVDPSSLANRLGLDLANEIILLHPHRPEEGKGLAETIRVVNRLVNKQGMKNIKVLIPEWIGSMISTSDSAFYNTMMRLMQDLGVAKYFKFVPWLPIEHMPELYSLGDVTLCLGNIVEAFGNVAYESLACGTPSIVSRVGVHRTLLADDLIDKVHFGDIDAAVDCVMKIVNNKNLDLSWVIEEMKSKMDFQKQVEAYATIIFETKKRERLTYSPLKLGDNQYYRLPPWCYFKDDFIFHDFHGRFENAPELASILQRSTSIRKSDALEAGIEQNIWEHWIDNTWIVPKIDGKRK